MSAPATPSAWMNDGKSMSKQIADPILPHGV
jgi:hypothetical protein